MLEPNNTITAHDSAGRALEAEVTNIELAKAALASVELEEIKKFVDLTAMILPRKTRPGPAFQPVKETKMLQVHPKDPAKKVIIGEDLGREQERPHS